MTRGLALRYAGWQVFDRTGPRVLACLVVGAAVLWPLHFAMSEEPVPPERLKAILAQLHQQFTFIFVVLLTHALISTDRVQGFYRFYFAKPVSPLWFYAQHVVLAGLGLLAASAGFITMSSLFIQPVWQWALLGNALALFLLVGMIIVAFSSVSKHDWLWMIVTMVGASVLRSRYPAAESTLGDVLHAVLPPNHLLGTTMAPTAAQWAWLGGWAVGLFVVTMLVLKFRPFGED